MTKAALLFGLLFSNAFASPDEVTERPYVRLKAVKVLRKSLEKKNIAHLKKQLKVLKSRSNAHVDSSQSRKTKKTL